MTAAVLLLAAASSAFVPENAARVREIAATLPEKPTMVDIEFRADGDAKDVKPAARLAASPVDPFPNDLYLEFSRNGNRTHYQEWRDRFLRSLGTLVSGEAAERKGRFAPAIAARLEAICAWPSWVLPAHDGNLGNFANTNVTVDLFSSDLARVLARFLGSVGDALPAETVRRVKNEVGRRVFAPYLERPQAHWWFFGHNNWNAVCHAGCVIAALELIEDRTTRARFVEGAERGLPVFLEFGFEKDGYCSEGMSYWNYGFGHFLELGISVRRATGGKVDYFAHPRAVKAMRYAFAYRLDNDISPRFADGSGNPDGDLVKIGLEVWPELKAEADSTLPLRSEFPDGQVWLMRLPAGEGTGFAFGCKGGHNAEHHNHNDVGSYNVLVDGELVAGDVGGEVYTARTFSDRRYESKVINSYGHPVPRVGGRLQGTGRPYAARVVKTDFTDAKDTVILDITKVYDCPTLAELTRTFSFDRAARTATVTDHVRFTAPTDFESPIMTTKPDRLKGHYFVTAKGGDWEETEERLENPGRETPYRRTIRFKAPVAEATVSVTFGDRN